MVCHGERIVMTSEGRQRTDETGGWRMAEYTKCYTCDGSGKMSPKKRAERIEELARLKEQSKKESEDD
ncbi:MAG: hypothetical protein HOA57_05020 [Candidatus Magasanikbacteria bacterium]|nr:hypothetical protein [Candidatus Magasanikbacteria bacterium]